jgi:hypothetical protein
MGNEGKRMTCGNHTDPLPKTAHEQYNSGDSEYNSSHKWRSMSEIAILQQFISALVSGSECEFSAY